MTYAAVGEKVELLIRTFELEVLHDAALRADDEFFAIAFLRVVHDSGGASGIIRLFGDRCAAFRMNQNLGFRMLLPSNPNVGRGDVHMSGAAALEELEILLRELFCDPCAQVAVRDEQDVLLRHILQNLNGRGRGDHNVHGGLQLRGGVDVSDGGISRIFFLHLQNLIPVHLQRHGASRQVVGQENLLLRGKNLNGFCHEANAGHDDGLLRCFRCLYAEAVGIADVVRNFPNIVALVGVGQDADILLLLQFNNSIL